MTEVTEMRKDFKNVFLSDIGTTAFRQNKVVQIKSEKKGCSSKRQVTSTKQQGIVLGLQQQFLSRKAVHILQLHL